jgi:hypothetical protein
MKIRIARRAYRVCRACRMRKAAMRAYIIIHVTEDGY